MLRFSDFRLDTANQRLWRNSEQLEIRPKTFQFLEYLARNPRRLISREELLTRVWGTAPGAGALLRVYSFELRRLLGDDPRRPQFLETLNRRGYRFLPEVVASDEGDDQPEVRGVAKGEFDEYPGSHSQSYDDAVISAAALPVARESIRNGSIRPRLPAPQRQEHPIKLGILHSLTGTMAYSEGPIVDAALLAIDEINRRGGPLGRRIAPIVADGKSETATFAQAAEWLIRDQGVAAILGCWMSAHRKVVLPIVERDNHLLLYPVQYEGLESSPNVFYLGAAPNQQIIPAIRWAFGFLNCKRIFLVGSDYIFPRIANEIIRDQMARMGGVLVGERYVPSGCVDMAALVDEVAAAKPDLIINTINGDSYISFFRLLRAHGLTAERTPVLSFSIGENELRNIDIAGNYAAWNYFQSIDRPENHRFVSAFRARYGPQRVTSDPMEAAYVGINLWAQAIAESGTAESSTVRKALLHQHFNAPQGAVQIDAANQHTWKTIRLGRIVAEGQFDIVYSSEHPIRPEPFPDSRSIGEWCDFLKTNLLS